MPIDESREESSDILDGGDPMDLVDLVADALEVLEDGGQEALEQMLSRHPVHAETVRRRVSLLIDSGLNPSYQAAAKDEVPEILGGFRLIRPLGHGGMGVVWLAEELSLGRQVALKLVRPDQLLFPGARERFRREVEVIARLQHPGIIPVYSVGEEKGLPYFAMEYVVGATLSEALKDMAVDDPRSASGAAFAASLPKPESGGDPSGVMDADLGADELNAMFQGSWPDVCARIITDVAAALEHARRRGVVHRDVKPSNIMITRGGRVQLFDFGLSSREGDARLTRTGALLGSLAYMPPESLAANSDVEDTRQDVYGLGVTLYELLALALPFPITNMVVLQVAIESADARPLRSANSSVPADLVAIVGKAMERDPVRRYATPGELAADLERFLSRRPVEARPPGLLLRTQRWMQRSPARAAALAALVIAPSVLFVQELSNNRVVEAKNATIEEANKELRTTNKTLEGTLEELGRTNAQLERSKSDLEVALEEVKAQSIVAETSFVKAVGAIDTMLSKAAIEKLAGIPGIEDVRRDLLEEALGLYEWFLDQDLSSPELQREVASIARRAGDISGFLSDLESSTEALTRSQELLEELVENDPVDAEARIMLADTKLRQAQQQRLLGDVDGSMRIAREGLASLDEMDFERLNEIGRSQVRRGRSGLLTEVAQCQELYGNVAEAVQDLEEAVRLLRVGLEEDPGDISLRYDLSRALDILAALRCRHVYDGINEPTDRATLETAYEETVEAATLAEGILTEQPTHSLARFRISRVLVNLAFILDGLGEREESAGILEGAIQHLRLLVDDNPEVIQYVIDLAGGLHNQAQSFVKLGDGPKATRTWEEALALLEPLARQQPRNFQIQKYLGSTLSHLSSMAAADGNFERAEELGQRGLSALRLSQSLSPSDPLLSALLELAIEELRTAFLTNERYSGLVNLGSAFLSSPPADMDLGRFKQTLELTLGAAPEELHEQLLRQAGKRVATELAAADLDIFALIDTEPGAELMDMAGFGEALEAALEAQR